MIKKKIELKGYKTQLEKVNGEISVIKNLISDKQKELNEKKKLVTSLESKISKIECNGKIHISEHAIIRYFERVLDFDIELVKKEILSNELLTLIEFSGNANGKYPFKDGRVVLKNSTIVTITN